MHTTGGSAMIITTIKAIKKLSRSVAANATVQSIAAANEVASSHNASRSSAGTAPDVETASRAAVLHGGDRQSDIDRRWLASGAGAIGWTAFIAHDPPQWYVRDRY